MLNDLEFILAGLCNDIQTKNNNNCDTFFVTVTQQNIEQLLTLVKSMPRLDKYYVVFYLKKNMTYQ